MFFKIEIHTGLPKKQNPRQPDIQIGLTGKGQSFPGTDFGTVGYISMSKIDGVLCKDGKIVYNGGAFKHGDVLGCLMKVSAEGKNSLCKFPDSLNTYMESVLLRLWIFNILQCL